MKKLTRPLARGCSYHCDDKLFVLTCTSCIDGQIVEPCVSISHPQELQIPILRHQGLVLVQKRRIYSVNTFYIYIVNPDGVCK